MSDNTEKRLADAEDLVKITRTANRFISHTRDTYADRLKKVYATMKKFHCEAFPYDADKCGVKGVNKLCKHYFFCEEMNNDLFEEIDPPPHFLEINS